jgi:hypothetical protein
MSVCLSVCLPIYGCTALVDLGRFFSFLIYTQSVGLLGRGISPSQGRYLHTEHNTNNTDIHASSGIRSHDPSVRAGEDGHCDWQMISLQLVKYELLAMCGS